MANIPKRNSLKEKERLSSEYNDIPLMSDEDRKKFPRLKYQCIYGENEEIFGNVERHVICSDSPIFKSICVYNGSQNIKKLLIKCYIDNIGHLENLEEIEHDSSANLCAGFARNCDKLKKVVFKEEVEIGIPHNAFLECKSLEEIKFDKGVKGEIESDAFLNCCKLSNIVLDGITKIGESAFQGCKALQKANMPNVEKIKKYAFSGCKALQKANMPNVETIKECAFLGCTALAEANMPSARQVGDNAFERCTALQKANMPSARQVGDNAFEGCKKLKNITVNSSASFGYACFGGLNLEKITFIGNLSDKNISDDFMEDTKVNEIKVTGKITDNAKKKILNQLHSDCQDKVKFS